jgi:hypothetical protein
MNTPVGIREEAASKIYPFKVISGKQISDSVYNILVPAKLWQGFWQHQDWDRAAREGLKLAGLPDSGTYTFVETITYKGLNHEVLPGAQALSCAACHQTLAKADACGRCHVPLPGTDFTALARKGGRFGNPGANGTEAADLSGTTGYLDFKALGYAGDPIEAGGRFSKLPLEMKMSVPVAEALSVDREAAPDVLPQETTVEIMKP